MRSLLAACLSLVGVVACRENLGPPPVLTDAGAEAGAGPAERIPTATEGGAAGSAEAGTEGGMDARGSGGRADDTPGSRRPPLRSCDRRRPAACEARGDSRLGVRLLGTVIAPDFVWEAGSLDLDAEGNIACVGCDCAEREGAGKLVLSCPDWVIAAGFINLHDHLGYAGTPPIAHPGELYEHRNDWRLGEHGHAALKFSGGASAAQVLAHELRHVMAGATSIVGSGGRRGLLRNLDQPQLTEGLLPGRIDAETFPLDDAAARVDSAACQFGPAPDTPLLAAGYSAYVPHVGEGTNQRARDELRCALGPLGLLGETSAVVHAMALTRADAKRLAQRGASVVWSPRSNIDLYGSTAPVALLTSLGVNLALGTDWLASGSMNVLRELACAKSYSDEVLGGYFDDAQLLGMVTAHAAWALGLERRLGELRPGLVGDVAVFAGQGGAFGSVVGASARDVRLVLRGGVPLYGDGELVRAFHDGEACEELQVCGVARRACVLETGLGLSEIQAAADAVYPLFSCGPPVDEPSCQARVSRECPNGEADCPAPGAGPSYANRDADEDGTPDLDDVCPRVFDDQTDRDGDARGDACDTCPFDNPGLGACALSIAQLRAPATRPSRGAAVRLSNARVTALRSQGSKGYYLEDGDHADYSGIFVYTGGTTPTVQLGELVDVQGYFAPFDTTDELIDVQVLAERAAAEPYTPRVVSVTDAADGSLQAAALQSLWLRIDEAEVAVQNPDAPQDYDETGLVGGLRLDDLLLPELDNGFTPGTRFRSIQGILGTSFGHQKLCPLSTADLVLE